MAWKFANSGELYKGEVHELGGNTYSGATRTPSSMRLEWTEDQPAPAVKKPARGKKT